jgi:type VI secretion system protein VasG
MTSDAIGAVLTLEQKLNERVKGQDAGLRVVSEVVRMAYAGIRNPEAPVGVLLFVGPSGVGKTETALALADLLYGGERFLTTINMSEFQEKHTVSRLIGSPPGYVGYGEGGVLSEAVRQRPYSVVLLDECEKADLEVMNLFYQVFDKGMLSDGEGRLIDFRNTLIILTSNLASDQVMKLFDKDEPPTQEEVATAIRPTLSKHFKPALLARMTIVPYAPISLSVMRSIAELKLGKLADRLRASHRLETTFSPALIGELVRRCTESEVGARNVEHTLRSSLMPAISRELLERLATGPLPRYLTVDLSPEGTWRMDFADA